MVLCHDRKFNSNCNLTVIPFLPGLSPYESGFLLSDTNCTNFSKEYETDYIFVFRHPTRLSDRSRQRKLNSGITWYVGIHHKNCIMFPVISTVNERSAPLRVLIGTYSIQKINPGYIVYRNQILPTDVRITCKIGIGFQIACVKPNIRILRKNYFINNALDRKT